jgi:DNA polymerase III epsilon subunit-like protein
MHHPKRKYDVPIWEWTDECAEAHEKRTKFIREYMNRLTFEDSMLENVKLCISYGEHKCQPDIIPTQEFVLLTQRLAPARLKYIVFDTETTGTSKEDVIIQLGYIAYDEYFNEVSTYEKILKSNRKSNIFALRIHGISDKKVSTSPYTLHEELEKFLQLLTELKTNGGILVAHNASFDMRMLKQSVNYCRIPWNDDVKAFCTMLALKKRSESERGVNCKNEQVYEYLGGKKLGKMHSALVDATATAYIYRCGVDRKWWV